MRNNILKLLYPLITASDDKAFALTVLMNCVISLHGIKSPSSLDAIQNDSLQIMSTQKGIEMWGCLPL